ncbi:MAG: hypothetical protein WCK03_00665 [Candidatus Taylorbacteria bacterium]
MTRTSFIRLIKSVVTLFLASLIVAFAIWRSLNYARGSSITITEPVNGSSISSKSVLIKGHVERAKNLILNGNGININEKGEFSITILVFPGINVVTLIAKDQFGRSTEQRIVLSGLSISTTTDTSIGNNNATTTTP